MNSTTTTKQSASVPTTTPAAASSDTAARLDIADKAITAHRAHAAWTSGRNGGVGYRGPDGMRDLEKKKGEAERALREAIRVVIGE